MICDIIGATLRHEPNDPDSSEKITNSCKCECNAPTINGTKKLTIKNKEYSVFDGCYLLRRGKLEDFPDCFNGLEFPEIPFFADADAKPFYEKADKFKQEKGKITKIDKTGIKKEKKVDHE